MSQIFGRLLRTAALASAFGLPAVQAVTVLDFEPAALTGLYTPDDTFSQGDYTFWPVRDFGIIDTAAALGSVSPTGNATQFYFNSNSGTLNFARTDGGVFNLEGFSAAFVPLDPASAQTTVIAVLGTKQKTFDNVVAFFAFSPSLTSHFAFSTYASPAAFANLTGLVRVEVFACSWVGNVACSEPTQNNGQFAIDDILVTAAPVPEATTSLLMTLGLIGLGLRARRSARRDGR